MNKLSKLTRKLKSTFKISKHFTLKIGFTSDARKKHHPNHNTER